MVFLKHRQTKEKAFFRPKIVVVFYFSEWDNIDKIGNWKTKNRGNFHLKPLNVWIVSIS